MQSVQPGQHEVDGEKIILGGKIPVAELFTVLEGLYDQKDESERNG